MKEEREEGIKEYEELCKKYKELPSVKQIEEEFEIKLQSPVVSLIMRVLLEKMGQSANHIEILFAPARMADMIECKFHDEEEKKKLFEFYKKTLALIHEMTKTLLENREARITAIINGLKFYEKELKPTMRNYLEKQAKGWLKQEKPEVKGQYFG
ncbi:hypothetical protein KY314_02850 [Candidatus Woesearchaeota archaeon]|nr:hypothetical protein [Candidatus Woesearchaeota archaeon]